MRNARLDEAQAGIKIAGGNINNLRYADDTTHMAESEDKLKSLLMKVKEESEKVGLTLSIQKTKILASGPITSWQIDGETVETVTDFIFTSAPALSTLSHALNLDWLSVSHMIIFVFQCYSLRSSYPRLLPQSPKDCSIHLCLFWCLAYRVIITIFWKILNYVKCLLQDHLMIHIESLCIWGIQPSAGYLPGAKQTVGGLWAPQDPHPTAYHRA